MLARVPQWLPVARFAPICVRCVQEPRCSPQSETFPPQPPPPASPRVLFGCFAGSTSLFDSSPACMHGLCFWLPVPIRRLVSPGCRRGLSVLARAVSRRAHGSRTTPDLSRTRDSVPASVAFPSGAHGRHPDCGFRSSIPGPSMLCLRFTRPLTRPSARLEVKMVRYSFPAGLFDPRLHAGLSRRLRSLPVAARNIPSEQRTAVSGVRELDMLFCDEPYGPGDSNPVAYWRTRGFQNAGLPRRDGAMNVRQCILTNRMSNAGYVPAIA